MELCGSGAVWIFIYIIYMLSCSDLCRKENLRGLVKWLQDMEYFQLSASFETQSFVFPLFVLSYV